MIFKINLTFLYLFQQKKKITIIYDTTGFN